MKRPFAISLLLALLFQLGFPSASMALTSGPSQPEVQSFEPVGTSQMVDPFSGDFTYNIPLLNVEDYPINISYHSGVGMDQEATWVGLGWNINPGVINRGMRGIPDDFKGESITKEFNMKPNRTFGLTLGGGKEFIGFDKVTKQSFSQGGLGYDFTLRFNNYTGVGVDASITGHIPLGKAGSTHFTGSLGLTSSSDNGMTIQPNISFAANMKKTENFQTKMNLSIGSAFNSRAGLQHLTCGVSMSRTYIKEHNKDSKSQRGGEFNKSTSSFFNFGMPTYTPELTLPFSNFSISASFKWGPELTPGVNPYYRVAGYYSCQKLTQNSTSQPAYGYLNADEGVKFDNAVMDFNREKDGGFTPNTPGLAVPNFTYDLLSVSGQGVGGSYRPFRSDFGQVFDPHVSNGSTSASIGAEIGLGTAFKIGVDVAVNNVNSQSGRWNNNDGSNAAHSSNHFTQSSSDPLYERYYYKEANEKSVDADPTYLQRAGGLTAANYKLNQVSNFNTRATANFTSGQAGASGIRAAREKRSQSISMLTRGEMDEYGLNVDPNLYRHAPSYHNAEITSTTPDGRRYVYGIAAYNSRQEETTFAVGTDEFGQGGHINSTDLNCNNGLISYSHIDNALSNKLGIDNYFSNTILPPYAHSYLLTSVLSADYVDSDTIRGPSINDLGNYTRFNYTRTDSLYKWRIPYEQDKATHNEGLKWTQQDDKGSYVYGEKEQWYLSSIETKNYVAIFQLEDRKDGFGVTDKNGGRSSAHKSKLLRKISLYTRVNYEAHAANSSIALIPLREVHFEYDYSLCPSVPNNSGATETVNGVNINQNAGKLTLKKISFSYQSSGKARLSPYTFDYSSTNPSYNIKGYDRWGNYKPQDASVTGYTGCDPLSAGLSNAEFPYVEQSKTSQDSLASAWSLTQIGLPSGGLMQVDYESDDYAYVQNKRAGQMFKIVGVSSNKTSPNDTSAVIYNTSLTDNSYLVIKLQNTITGSDPNGQFRDQYLKGLDYIYFRVLYNMSNPNSLMSPVPDAASTFEYVPGYIQTSNIYESGVYPGGQYAYIRFNSVHINDNSLSATINPITKAALQFGRLNEAKNMWKTAGVTSSTSFSAQFLQSLIQTVTNIADLVEGPNRALFTNHNCCQSFMLNKSWIRLNNPNMHKLGGGYRVKKISVADQWSSMTSSAMPSFSYGQEYFYENEDGSSSGVASYEPQLGGDENSLHTPVFFDAEKLLAPDDENYLEEPFGECFFPSPSVGYGRVTVQNIKYTGVTKHASGKVVHEFYTAKDFPTITNRSGVDAIREKTDPLSLSSFLQINVKDYMTASQGYYIELNDMHGKPKAQEVYQEGVSTPISSIEYVYKDSPYLNGSFRLDNTAQVISPTGAVSSKNVGVFFDFITDFREQKSSTIGGSINYNNDVLFVILGTVDIPTVWPGYNKEDTRFRSAVSSKVVQRFGLIDKVIAKDLGSTVETQNLAYDSETGEVILTQTKTDYNDPLYSLKFPAYWYYDGMGPAYKNIGLTLKNISNSSLGIATVSHASTYFTEGDELEMNNSSDSLRVWVTAVSSGSITVRNKAGNRPAAGTYELKVIRSGRRNMQMENMASITTLQNPLTSIGNNQYEKVIAASGVEYKDQWNAFCDCTSDLSPSYATGLKGNWRPSRSFAYLTNRTQSNYDNNTNTRIDGVFTSFNPLYKKAGAAWQFDTVNWTFTSLVTKINPNGQELENKDALGRYSAATYGYKQTLATAVGANTMYRDLGFDNMEEYGGLNCADNHFKFNSPHIDSTQSHTGRRSIKVTAGSPLVMTRSMDIGDCAPATNICQISMVTVAGTGITPPRLGGGGGGGGGPSVASFTFSGTGVVAPLTISWTVNEGTPVVSASGSSISIQNSATLWEITITVTGATGCTQQFTISNN